MQSVEWWSIGLVTGLLALSFPDSISAADESVEHGRGEEDSAAGLRFRLGVPLPAPSGDSEESTGDGDEGEQGVKTLGGRLFWGDISFFRGWRIQKNVFTGHYRLLDPHDGRQASGSLEECRQTLDDARKQLALEPMSGRAVILIHGISRSSKSFSAMKKAFETDGLIVVPFDYPSTRVSISESVGYLNSVIESLEGVEQIDFVVHSMGGLLVRAYLKEHRDPRIGRLVMLGVPNHGARMANLLKDLSLFKFILGPAGQELAEDPEGFITGLPTPDFPFAVIAGARGTEDGFNPLIPGDDDGTISVSTTHLPGETDFLTVPSLHTFLTGNPEVIAASRRFLNGRPLKEPLDDEATPGLTDEGRASTAAETAP